MIEAGLAVLGLVMAGLAQPRGAVAAPAPAAAKSQVVLTVATRGEEMAFDKAELNVKAGEKVKLVFKNLSSMQHNWVLVKPGTADAVANASIAAGDSKGWLAVGPDVLAHTKLVDGKQSDTIEFTAPAKPGEYTFVCTFPGHASMMRGVFRVK